MSNGKHRDLTDGEITGDITQDDVEIHDPEKG